MDGTRRALRLLDVEYLGLGPDVTADDPTLVLDGYRPLVDWHAGDRIFGTVADTVNHVVDLTVGCTLAA